MINGILLKKSIQETLSDQIIKGNNIDSLEKKIEKMVYDFPKHKTLPGKIMDDARGIYRYYFDPVISTNKRAYTKILYNELKSKEYSERLAITIAKATPVRLENKSLKALLALGYAITMGRNMSERHFNWISKKSGMGQKTLMHLSFVSEPPLHLITAGQLYPQIYAVTKGISETMKRLADIDINMTPNYEQIFLGLCTISAAQFIFYKIKKKYVRAYQSATSLPFGAIAFWMSTAHNRYVHYQEKAKQSENPHIS